MEELAQRVERVGLGPIVVNGSNSNGESSATGPSTSNGPVSKSIANGEYDPSFLLKPNQQFHLHWIDTTKLSCPEAGTVIKEIELEGDEDGSPHAAGATISDNLTLRKLQYSGFETISDVLTYTFLNKFKNDETKAKEDLNEALQLVSLASRNKFIEKEYLDGISFVIGLLADFINDPNSKENTTTGVGLPGTGSKDKEYASLTQKGRVAILAMKLYFITRLPPKFWDMKAQQSLATKMIEMDPGNGEWYLCLYRQYWFQYRDTSNLDDKKDCILKMKTAIEDAMRCNEEHPLILLHFCECLVELSKPIFSAGKGQWHGEIKMASRTFSNAKQFTDCILETNEKIRKLNPSIYVYVKIAMGLFMRINKSCREKHHLEFAKECLDNALELNPNSSNVIHKLGLYELTIEGNLDKAVEHFHKSLALFPHNFSALADYIQTLMANPIKNGAKVLQVIEENLGDKAPWSEQQKHQLRRFKGYALFMEDKKIEGIKCWTDGCGDWDFTHLSFRLYRYKWPIDKISLDLILQQLDQMIETTVPEASNDAIPVALSSFKKDLQVLRTHVEQVLVDSRRYTPRRSSDNGRYRGGSRRNSSLSSNNLQGTSTSHGFNGGGGGGSGITNGSKDKVTWSPNGGSGYRRHSAATTGPSNSRPGNNPNHFRRHSSRGLGYGRPRSRQGSISEILVGEGFGSNSDNWRA